MMIAAVPKLKITEIANDIAAMLADLSFNEFALKKREFELEKLAQLKLVEPSYYHLVRAMIHGVRRNFQESVSSAKSALALAPRDKMILGNVVGLLCNFGEIRQGIVVLNSLVELLDGEKEALLNAARQAHGLLQFSLVRSTLERMSLLDVNDATHSNRIRYLRLAQIEALNWGFSDEDYADRLHTATSALNELGRQIRRMTSLTTDDGHMLIHLHVDGSFEETAALNFVIAEALVSKFADPAAEMVTIQCLPTDTFGEMAVYEKTNEY